MWILAATGRLTARVVWLGVRVGCHLELSLHFSNELGDISQWLLALSQDKSTTHPFNGPFPGLPR